MKASRMLIATLKEAPNEAIISSHILSELYNVATCYGFLSKGKLVEELSLEELNERCKSYLEINVTNPKKLSVLLEERLGYKNYKIMPDGVIHLFEKNPVNEEISKLAVDNNIGLKGINEKSANLENYYLSLIGGVKNA